MDAGGINNRGLLPNNIWYTEAKKGSTMHCPKCHSKKYVKSGFTNKRQRYKCKECECNFTQSFKRGVSVEIKIQALHCI